MMFILFFFFQAEDGIRDYKVTGVQTCALPISEAALLLDFQRVGASRKWRGRRFARRARLADRRHELVQAGRQVRPRHLERSEERRVGKGVGYGGGGSSTLTKNKMRATSGES